MKTIQIDGMSCGHCVRAVEQALRALDGVDVHTVEVGTVQITQSDAVTDEQIRAAIEEEGYQVRAIA